MPRERIQSLWVGTRLSTMERLSIASFLFHGHDYHLFTYGPVEGLPAGAVREDAREVLPESSIFQYRDFESYAGFANFFRYKLLLERGGWWVDTDAVCLRPFDFPEPYVIATEPIRGGGEVPTSSFLKAPAGSRAFAHAWESCRSRDPGALVWGETGPRLLGEVVERFGLNGYLQPHATFCPVGYLDWGRLTEADASLQFDGPTRAVHLWHEQWRRHARDKDRAYPHESPFEAWKRRYLSSTARP
jgi:hypothetical protein